MKVIHLISGGDSGGAKTHVLSLLQHLNQTITAQLVCFRDGPFAEEARQMGIPTMICGGNNVFRTRRKLAAYIREGGYEIIHCHGSRANMIGAMLRRPTGLPVVTTVHSDYRLDYMGRPFSHLTFGTINALALRKLDYRIGVSDAMVDLLISRGFPADRFYAIYNGIDFTPPAPQGDRLAYLRSLGANVDRDSVVVGIAARLNPVKDMATLVRGFAAGYAQCPRLRLVIAGEGPEKDKLAALARELGVQEQVCFAGWISGGMDPFYAALDINALTSLSETFPYALTDGTRFHLATVATAVGGRSIKDNGHYVAGIVRACKKNGLNLDDNYVEDMAGFTINKKTMPMGEMKRDIYFGLKQMIFGFAGAGEAQRGDRNLYREWEHAGDIFNTQGSRHDGDYNYYGFSISRTGNIYSMHFISVPSFIVDSKEFNNSFRP